MSAPAQSETGRRGWRSPRGMRSGQWLWLLLGLGTWTMIVAWLLRFSCHQLGWNGAHTQQLVCYSDIGYLFTTRGMSDGSFAYLSQDPSALLEYPLLQSLIATTTGRAAYGLGEGLPVPTVQNIYFDLNAALLLLVWLAVVVMVAAMGTSTVHTAALAVSPAVAATALINWDLWPVLTSVAALLAFQRSRWAVGGVLLGLGTALKLWPFVMLGAVIVLALRRRELRPAVMAVVSAVVAWVVVNVPFALWDRQQWSWFWSFSGERGAGFSSIYHVWNVVWAPELGAQPLAAESLNVIAYGVFALCCAGVLVLGLKARREPTLAELSLLIVAAFVLTNKVYSPQFVLWLVPLVILAAPRLREYAVWQVIEVVHWIAVFTWLYSMVADQPNAEAMGRFYAAAVVLHILAVVWLCARVVVRLLRGLPVYDPDRIGGSASETGSSPAILSADRSAGSFPARPLIIAGEPDTRAGGAGRHG